MKCIKEPAFATRIAANGKDRAFDMFSVEKFTANYETVYNDIMQGKL